MTAVTELLRDKGVIWLLELVAAAMLPSVAAEPVILGARLMAQTIGLRLTWLRATSAAPHRVSERETWDRSINATARNLRAVALSRHATRA